MSYKLPANPCLRAVAPHFYPGFCGAGTRRCRGSCLAASTLRHHPIGLAACTSFASKQCSVRVLCLDVGARWREEDVSKLERLGYPSPYAIGQLSVISCAGLLRFGVRVLPIRFKSVLIELGVMRGLKTTLKDQTASTYYLFVFYIQQRSQSPSEVCFTSSLSEQRQAAPFFLSKLLAHPIAGKMNHAFSAQSNG